MAAAEVDVLQLADRPWAEISAIRLTGTPAPLPPPPLPEDDSVQCDFRPLLFVSDGPVPPFADCDIRGRPAHRVFTQGVRRPGALPAAYGRRGAASRAGAREKVLDALDTRLFTDTTVRYGAAKIKAHRCILHAQSPFCRAALQFAPQNGVDLPFCGAALEKHLRRLVAYLYTRDGRELEELLDACYAVWKSTSARQCVGCTSHFSAMMRPRWLPRAVRNRHRHAIEEASRRWRGGRRDESARTRRKTLISTQVLRR